MGYLRDSGKTDCYVHVQLNNSGTITNISYVESVDINKRPGRKLKTGRNRFYYTTKTF